MNIRRIVTGNNGAIRVIAPSRLYLGFWLSIRAPAVVNVNVASVFKPAGHIAGRPSATAF